LLLGDIRHLVVKTVHGLLEVLAGLLGVLLDLSSIGSNVLVGLVDLGVGGRSQSGQSTLLCGHGKLELLRGVSLVLAHDLTSLAGTGNGALVTLVLTLSEACELSLHHTHVTVQIVLGLLGIDGHLGEERLLHLGASGLVVSKVLCHLGANRSDVSLAPSDLLSNLLLNLVEEGKEALAAVGGVRHDEPSLLDIHRFDGRGVQPIKASTDVSVRHFLSLGQHRL
jgi:hypothetical protein